MPLPNEIQNYGECEPEFNTGLTFDDRYVAASKWEMSEADIMKENGVYEELYNEEPEVAISRMDFDYEDYRS